MKKKWLVCLSALLVVLNGAAQIQKPDDNIRHIAISNLGYDHNLLSVNVGYAFYQPRLKTAAFVDLTKGTALLKTGNYRSQIGIQTWQGSSKEFNLKSLLALVYTRSTNKAGEYDALGFNIQINAGIKRGKLGFGTDFQYNPFLSTRIKHSDLWRQYYYENAKDGRYGFSTNNLRIGMYLTTLIQPSLEFYLRGGYQTTGEFDKLIPPYYAILGLNKKF
ncbi:MAG: hypothetical protein SFV55_09435 [Haliscomenobacter sp.]|uniref:hypothetical protein n=1 Tax=Haliscomenobacter sp. TaxID=2717303 RepID=UPI0029A9AF6B|nr:hypothetical protein [Haliscomenobacter sp.]MDX2068636.1 hypothetical protein [Haliscomenobacter sp.]